MVRSTLLLRRVLTVVGCVALPLVSVGLGLGVMTAAARLWTRPAALLATGLLATGLAAWCGLRLLARRMATGPRRWLTSSGALAVVLLGAVLLLTPMSDPRLPPAPVPGTRYWQLSTGSRLAYVHVPAAGPRQPTPVVVLHGGPGIADMAGDAAYFGQLSRLGFDVYVYDQLGSGRSTRLADPRGYSVQRDAADLEQVRRAIGADRLILVGHSYGGSLAAHYLAEHPQRVARLILSSPGALDPADTSGDQARSRLTTGRQLRTYAAVLSPRPLLGYALLQVNPAAAHAFLPDAEADARNDTVLSLADAGLHCRPPEQPVRVRGSGFYALQYPQSATAPAGQDVRPQLRGLRTPVLIFKGSCDYLSWQSAGDYRQTLSQSAVVYLPGAGHNTYQDRPAEVMAETRAFVTGGRLPIAPYTGAHAPADYQTG